MENNLPVELVANKSIQLLAFGSKALFYLFFVDSNIIVKEIELSKYFANTFYPKIGEVIVNTINYNSTMVVDDKRFVLIHVDVFVGVSGVIEVYNLM